MRFRKIIDRVIRHVSFHSSIIPPVAEEFVMHLKLEADSGNAKYEVISSHSLLAQIFFFYEKRVCYLTY